MRFNNLKLYNPADIELGALRGAKIAAIIKSIEIPDSVSDRLQEWGEMQEEEDYNNNTIIVNTVTNNVNKASNNKSGKKRKSIYFNTNKNIDLIDIQLENQLPTPAESATASQL